MTKAANIERCIKTILLWMIVAFCLVQRLLYRYNHATRVFEDALISLQSIVLVWLVAWCGTFLIFSFNLKNLPLAGVLVIAVTMYFVGDKTMWQMSNATAVIFCVTLGKVAQYLFESERLKVQRGDCDELLETGELQNSNSTIVNLMFSLVGLLAFSSCCHLDMSGNSYQGPRWMGLWDDPNTYGMLMGAGMLLAIGFLTTKERRELKENSNSSFRFSFRSWSTLRGATEHGCAFAAIKSAVLLVAAGMLGVGLVMSYSRGAWLGTAIGLLYLAWSHGKLKARHILLAAGVLALAAGVFWGRTPDSAPWYVKRADLARPSAQHRAAAWRAGFEIMRDHPLGVGWNNAVNLYDKSYSPPEGGAAAITTNDYMMIGTELGIPALLCFVVYVGLCLRGPREGPVKMLASNPGTAIAAGASVLVSQGQVTLPDAVKTPTEPVGIMPWDEARHLRVVCRAGALVFVVAFWFDGGLFKLPTAALFWVLLELGAEHRTRQARLPSNRVS